MAELTKLVEMVAPRVPEAPDPVIEDAAVQVLRDFCVRTRVWRALFEAQLTVPGSPFVWLSAFGPRDAYVFDIDYLAINGKHIDSGTEHRAIQLGLARDTRRPAEPKMYEVVPGDELRLYPTPDKEYELSGQGYFAPKDTITTIPDFIMDRFARPLMHGVIVELGQMPGKPWTSQDLLNTSAPAYAQGMDDAMRYGNGMNRSKIRVTSYGGL